MFFLVFSLAVPSSEKFCLLKVTKSKIEQYQVLWLARYTFPENNWNTLWVFFSIQTSEGTRSYILFKPQNQRIDVTQPICCNELGEGSGVVQFVSTSSPLMG